MEVRERWMPGKHGHGEPRRLRQRSLGTEEVRRHGEEPGGCPGRGLRGEGRVASPADGTKDRGERTWRGDGQTDRVRHWGKQSTGKPK